MNAPHGDALRDHVTLVLRRSGLTAEREADVRAEMLGHLEDYVERALAAGEDVDHAVERAIREFGDPASVRARLRADRLRHELRSASKLPGILPLVFAVDVLALVGWVNLEIPAAWDVGLRREALTLVICVVSIVVYWICAVLVRFSATALRLWTQRRAAAVEGVLSIALLGIALAAWLIVRPGLLSTWAQRAVEREPTWRLAVDTTGLISIATLVVAGLELVRQLWPARATPR